ncbi:UNVERIFIED_ORG: hypothetical protein FHR35_003918 [Microbispora rosea subsp. rosea]
MPVPGGSGTTTGVRAPHPKDYHRDDPGNAVTEDGRAAAVAVTRLPESLEMLGHVEKAVDTALCS